MNANRSLAVRAMPGLFVLLWSTGFIGAKFGLPFAEPNTFLFYRMMITSLILLAAAVAFKRRWPKTLGEAFHITFAGVLMHCGYLGGVFGAISIGMPSGLAAILVGLQPLTTAFAAGIFLKEKTSLRQWFGLLLGLIGVSLVLGEKAFAGHNSSAATLFSGFSFDAVLLCMMALIAITISTLYQKRFCAGADLVSGGFLQYGASAMVFFGFALGLETMEVTWSPTFWGALLWLVLGLSVGAVGLLAVLMRQGESARVASLFYLVPPVTSLEAYFLFDEHLGLMALTGMTCAALGVAMVVSPKKSG